MNKERKEELWSAYLDGELSCSEAREYDKSLTEEERARFAAELRFEEALAGRLCDDVRCPDELWKRVTRRLTEESSPRRRFLRLAWRTTPLAAAAAALLVVCLRHPWAPTPRESAAVALAPDTAPAPDAQEDFLAVVSGTDMLIHRVEIDGDEVAVGEFMRRHGFPFRLQPVSMLAESTSAGHPVQFFGARERMVDGERVLELMWQCCGQPVVVELAAEGTAPARRIHKAADGGQIQEVRQFGRHVAALVSSHKAKPFLDLVQLVSPDFS
jgi:hypothetical protein